MNSSVIARVNHFPGSTDSSSVIFKSDEFLLPCELPALPGTTTTTTTPGGSDISNNSSDRACLVPQDRNVIVTRVVVAPPPPQPEPEPERVVDTTVIAPFSRKNKTLTVSPVAAAAPAKTEDDAHPPVSVNGFGTFKADGTSVPASTGDAFGGFDVPASTGDAFGGFDAPASTGDAFGGFDAPASTGDAFGGFDAPASTGDAFGGFDAPVSESARHQVDVSLKVVEQLLCIQKPNSGGALQVSKFELNGKASASVSCEETGLGATDIKLAVQDPQLVVKGLVIAGAAKGAQQSKAQATTVLAVRCSVPSADAEVLSYTPVPAVPVVLARYKSSVSYKPVSTPPSAAPTVFTMAKLAVQVPLHSALTAANSKYYVDSMIVQVSLSPLLVVRAAAGGVTSIGQLQLQPKEGGQFNPTSKVVQWVHKPVVGKPLPSVMEFQAIIQLCALGSEEAAEAVEAQAKSSPTNLQGIVKFTLSKSLPSQVSVDITGATVAENDTSVVMKSQNIIYCCRAEYRFI